MDSTSDLVLSGDANVLAKAKSSADAEARPFLDAYANAFPRNVASAEVWSTYRREIIEHYQAEEIFRENLPLWEKVCASAATRGEDGALKLVFREFYAKELEEADERERERKARTAFPIPPPPEKFRDRLRTGLAKLVTGQVTRQQFIEGVERVARENGAWDSDCALVAAAYRKTHEGRLDEKANPGTLARGLVTQSEAM